MALRPITSRTAARAGGVVVALSLLVAPTSASADDPNDPEPNVSGPIPNLPRIPIEEGPICGTLPDTSIDEFRTYDEMTDDMRELADTARFDVELTSFGESNQGRDLWMTRVGNGDRVLLMQGMIHGNEKASPEAVFRMMDWLGNSNARSARVIREELTIIGIPQFNPDGGELDQRQNARTWQETVDDFPQLAGTEPAWNYNPDAEESPGFDVNRDFHPDLDYVPQPEDFPGDSAGFGWFINPESQALRDLYLDLEDEFGQVDAFVDVHHQGPCVARDDTEELIDVSVDYPPLPDWEFEEGGKYADYEDSQDASRQLAMSAYAGIDDEGYLANRYHHAPERDIPGQARSAFALNGTATVLFEIRGQTQHFGDEGRERFTRAAVAGLYRMIDELATGEVDDYDPDAYDELPGTTYLDPENEVAPFVID
ncbi:MAG TPA: M14 family zinc carboxypeptidase [Jiangellaceae bacterium]|nr:M14 family zinc carboxypeptidase [Jiangellaceae bacterium]